MVEKLLKVRQEIKKRKPTYRRQQSNQFAKFKNDDRWRRPKGLQSKIRLKRKGHQGMPEVGFKSPKAVRGLSKAGFQEVIVKNVEDLKKVDSKTQIAVISRTVGGRKKLTILNEALKLKLSISNVKDINETIKALTKTPKTEKKKEKKVNKTDSKKKSTPKSEKKTEAKPKKEESEK